MINKNVTEQIGSTPLIELNKSLSASVQLLESGQLRNDAKVVTILCDTGLKF